MKMWRLIRHRRVILLFLTCFLLALLASGAVNLGSPAARTPIGSPGRAGLPQKTQSNGAIELLNDYRVIAPNWKKDA